MTIHKQGVAQHYQIKTNNRKLLFRTIAAQDWQQSIKKGQQKCRMRSKMEGVKLGITVIGISRSDAATSTTKTLHNKDLA